MNQFRMFARVMRTVLLTSMLTGCATATLPADSSTHPSQSTALPALTATPYKPVATEVPASISSSSTVQEPAACTFPLAKIATSQSAPEEYSFSEPKVVLTAPEGNPLNVAAWLPDNQQVLVTEELRDQWKSGNPNDIQESSSLYNLETGASKLYAIASRSGGEPPIWVPNINGVVYSSVTFSNMDTKNRTYETHRKLWVSYGDPNNVHLLADNLQLPFMAKPDGSEIAYISNKQISKLDKSLKKLSSSSAFDPDQWDYAKARRNKNPVYYRMAWQPGTSLVFLYSAAGIVSFDGGYTFILNTATGRACELNFGGWAFSAHWSPNGRYLAIAKATSYTGASSTELAVLDSVTGNLRTIDAALPDAVGEHYVIDFAWTPDNLHLLAFENVPSLYDLNRRETYHYDLYLIDLTSDQSVHLLPEFRSFGGSQNNFVWSPDGSKLLVHCPLSSGLFVTDRYCLISSQSAKR